MNEPFTSLPEDSAFPSADSELGRLVTDMCSGTATAADVARLDQLLESPVARRAYVALMQLHGELLWRWRKPRRDSEAERADDTRAPAREPMPGRAAPAAIEPRRLGAAFARLRDRGFSWLKKAGKMFSRPEVTAVVLATLVVAAGLTAAHFTHVRPDGDGFGARSGRGPIVAEITGLHHVQWADRRRPPPSLWIKAGTVFDIEAGLLQISHACGARVIVEGPALVQVETGSAISILRGKVAARYDRQAATGRDQGPPFVVQTPQARIIDLGTEFGVGVSDDEGTSQIHVFDGLVDVEPAARDPNRGPTRLAAGDATEIDAAGRINRPRIGFAKHIKRKLPGAEPPAQWIESEAITLAADGFEGTGSLQSTRPVHRGGVGNAAWRSGRDAWAVQGGRLRFQAGDTDCAAAVYPFTPEPGCVYRISAEIDLPAGDPGWAAISFCEPTDAWPFYSPTYCLMGQRGSPTPFWGGNFVYAGPERTNRIGDVDARFGRHVRMVQLDTRGARWKAKFFVDGTEVAWFVFGPGSLPIGGIRLEANDSAPVSFDNFKAAVYRPRPAAADGAGAH